MGTQCVQGLQQYYYDAALQEPCPQQIRVLLPHLESNKDRGHQSHRISPKNVHLRDKWPPTPQLLGETEHNVPSFFKDAESDIIHMWKVCMAQVL